MTVIEKKLFKHGGSYAIDLPKEFVEAGNTEIIVASRHKETSVFEVNAGTASKRITINNSSVVHTNQLTLF